VNDERLAVNRRQALAARLNATRGYL